MSIRATILVVDDDNDVSEMIAEYLEGHGFEVVVADGAAAMWRILGERSVDLVLLDRTMPGGDGLAHVPTLRARYGVGIIMLTALSAKAERLEGLEGGADDYVTKPFDWRELTARIGNVLRRVHPDPSVVRVRAPCRPLGENAERRIAAVLCADVAGYVRLMQDDEEGTMAMWWRLRREVVDPTVSAHGGHIVKLTGDGFFCEFATAEAALACAAEIQSGVARVNSARPPDRRMLFRIGLTWCSIVDDGEDIYGDGVNMAARISALAQPGAVCASRGLYDAVGDPKALGLVAIGNRRVKNVAEPIEVYALHPCTARPQAA